MSLVQSDQQPLVSVRIVTQQRRTWVWLALPYLPKLLPSVRSLPGVQWDAPQRVWQFPYDSEVYKAMKDILENKVILDCQEADTQIAELEARAQIWILYAFWLDGSTPFACNKFKPRI